MNPDIEYVAYLEIVQAEVTEHLHQACAAHNAEKATNLRGILRGIEMAKESYLACWQIREVSGILLDETKSSLKVKQFFPGSGKPGQD